MKTQVVKIGHIWAIAYYHGLLTSLVMGPRGSKQADMYSDWKFALTPKDLTSPLVMLCLKATNFYGSGLHKIRINYKLPFSNHAYGTELTQETWRGASNLKEGLEIAKSYEQIGYTPVRIGLVPLL
jgi:hypothetical protein